MIEHIIESASPEGQALIERTSAKRAMSLAMVDQQRDLEQSRCAELFIQVIASAFGGAETLPVCVAIPEHPEWAKAGAWRLGVFSAILAYINRGWTTVALTRSGQSIAVAFDVPDPRADPHQMADGVRETLLKWLPG